MSRVRHAGPFRGLATVTAAAATLFVAAACGGEDLGMPFATPEEAAEALVAAAEAYDVPALREILGPAGEDIIASQDPIQDSLTLTGFAEEARASLRLERDSTGATVVLNVGPDEWPLPIPLVADGEQWRFDTPTGREEILARRVGRNELDAIEVCLGYVEAQREYAMERHDGATVNQYAQRIISTPGRRDGLAWRNEDGTWSGPVSEGIAQAIADGHTSRTEPFNGYYYKVLTGQGPAAPLGAIDFVVQGAMIGGFALVAAPADYGVTGIQTFIVSHNGIVYEKDLGEETLDVFQSMELFDPDSTWTPVPIG